MQSSLTAGEISQEAVTSQNLSMQIIMPIILYLKQSFFFCCLTNRDCFHAKDKTLMSFFYSCFELVFCRTGMSSRSRGLFSMFQPMHDSLSVFGLFASPFWGP
jgi:hypothetical protein